jgi:alpha-beta hydrolase superfamily lysophospholipase
MLKAGQSKMFETFQLKSHGAGLMGYSWTAKAPEAAVCLIHGIGEHAGRYSRVAEFFAERGISTVAMDLRGHGCSVGVRGHIGPRNTVLRDVDNLILSARKRCGEIPVVVYGHSMGGNIALDYRLCGALSALPAAWIVSSPWLKLCKKTPAPLYHSVKFLSLFKPDFQLRSNVGPEFRGNREILGKIPHETLSHGSISARTALESVKVAEDLLAGRIPDRFGGGEKPLFLMHGTADRICSIEGARTLAALEGERCTLIEWEGYFHELHHGNDTKTGEEVIEKIAEIILRFRKDRQEAQV